MATFPSGIFAKNTYSAGQTLSASNHLSNHNNIQDEIIALETKVGVDGSTVANTLDWISNQGYRRETGTVAYASATTFTIAGVDRTTVYTPGTLLRINADGTPVYVYVVSSTFSTNTTVTVNASTVPNPITTVDYTVSPLGNYPSAPTLLGYAEVTSNQTGITTEVDLTGLTVTVTVPAGGRRVKITGYCEVSTTGTAGRTTMYIKESTTKLQQASALNAIASSGANINCQAVILPSAGSHTYKLSMESTSGTSNTATSASAPAYILAELI